MNRDAAPDRLRRKVPAALVAAGLLTFAAACGRGPQDLLPAPTPTAAPTPTPLPVLDPISMSDAVRVAVEREPQAEPGAPCGRVDLLDFPMGPPEGIDHGPRWPYGRFSRRYNKIHAGEDWAYAYGPSLGRPVHAIGHGQVTYAQPLGWGGDKGVVIVRHTFEDGSTKLSFYGHLDENSISLRPGECVRRGEELGKVGNPRTRPHLHFEIRDHMPTTPGPGYWSTDPSTAGWDPPSEFIFERRVLDSPGLRWSRTLTTTRRIITQPLPGGDIGLLEEREVRQVDPVSGELRWSKALDAPAVSAVADESAERIYWADADGNVGAIEGGQPRWTRAFSQRSTMLLPRAGGGLIVHADERLLGLNGAGETDWQRFEAIEDVASWSRSEDGRRLVFSTQLGARSGAGIAGASGPPMVYSIDAAGDLRPVCAQAGQVALAGDSVVVYRAEGIYACGLGRSAVQASGNDDGAATDGSATADGVGKDPVPGEADDSAFGETRLLMGLEGASVGPGSIVSLPEGGVAVSHRGALGARIIVFDAALELRWQRKIDLLVDRALSPTLHIQGRRLLAMTRMGDLFEIDRSEAHATRVFAAGRGPRLGGEAELRPAGNEVLLLDFRGGRLLSLNPPSAPKPLEAAGD